MHVIARKTLRDFWEGGHADAEEPLIAWYKEAESAVWHGPNDIKMRHPSVSIISNDRVVFNIKGNTYRLIVAVKYKIKIVYIRFVGTHAEYDKINAREV